MSGTTAIRQVVLDLIEQGSAPRDVGPRVTHLENFRLDEGSILFDLMRHPALRGVPTDVGSSTACFIVRQTYRTDQARKTIILDCEVCEDIRVYGGMNAVVAMDAVITADAAAGDFASQDEEGSLGIWARAKAESIAPRLRDMMFPIEGMMHAEGFSAAWESFIEGYLNAWKLAFVREVVRRR